VSDLNLKYLAKNVRAEFDQFADNYHDEHAANVAVTGEGPEYFAEYKIADLARLVAKRRLPSQRILDFGSGIGNSIPYFRKYFPNASVACADISARSMEIARKRFPGGENFVLISDNRMPLEDASQDVIFSACVFHHIPHNEHEHWLKELRRVVHPSGILVIYEHNPLNPLTVRAVNTCPFDVNARLIQGGIMRKRALAAGWAKASVDYRVFFPSLVRFLRPFETHLGWLALGAQYRLTAYRHV
jgi:ubiquinone/menaquinone biosynthesis C-methylase UbiE